MSTTRIILTHLCSQCEQELEVTFSQLDDENDEIIYAIAPCSYCKDNLTNKILKLENELQGFYVKAQKSIMEDFMPDTGR